MVDFVVDTSPSKTPFQLGAVSPAAHLAQRFAAAEVTGSRGVRLQEAPFLIMVGLRLAPGSTAAARIETRLGTSLPATCGSVNRGEGLAVLWLSPDELLVVADWSAPQLPSVLLEALDGDPGAVTDLSANRTTFELSGLSARGVLEKGCPLDLHPRVFETDTAYATTIGSVPVVLWKVAEESFRILPRSSFADFLGRWLVDAMAEFQAADIP